MTLIEEIQETVRQAFIQHSHRSIYHHYLVVHQIADLPLNHTYRTPITIYVHHSMSAINMIQEIKVKLREHYGYDESITEGDIILLEIYKL